MDLREIIKWFIPCFHVLLYKISHKMDFRLTICLFLIFSCPSLGKVYGSAHEVLLSDSFNNNHTKNLEIYNDYNKNQSRDSIMLENNSRSLADSSMGRTFGRPFKKMLQALVPLAFQMGAAATWAVVAAIVGVKTLAVALIILKLLLVAGAAKIGALFASKGHHAPEHHGWTPHQKEIHLHIHNSGSHGDEHAVPLSPWSREGVSQAETKHVNVILDPYANGPQTISTPYGHYMKIDPGGPVTQ